jgi:hypothetical protein
LPLLVFRRHSERSSESLYFVFAFAVALAVTCFSVVILSGAKEPCISPLLLLAVAGSSAHDSRLRKPLIPLPLSPHKIIFRVFGPEIACQVPKPPNPFLTNNIHLAF